VVLFESIHSRTVGNPQAIHERGSRKDRLNAEIGASDRGLGRLRIRIPVSETITERTLGRDSEAHTLITPPPVNVPPANLASQPGTTTAVARAREEERVDLFAANESTELRARWDIVQVGFVDEPRKAVADADALVSATVKRLAEIFADERQKLEQQWDRSENIST
jgi:hypothetical protein